MLSEHSIALAAPDDATRIASLSRDHVESGLGWRWTPERIVRVMRDASVNCVAARAQGELAGFGIMRYRDDDAHLALLAVDPRHRRQRIATALLEWFEASALTAGIGCIYLEARAGNSAARAFYRSCGYREIDRVSRLYSAREDGVRIAKDLWANPSSM